MATQIPFPNEGSFPPERPYSRQDEIIDNIFQVLPAISVIQIQERLNRRGFQISEESVRQAIKHLRKNAEWYQWTIPHVHGGRTIDDDERYFAILVSKDDTFYTDPCYKTQMLAGTTSIVTRISTESGNQGLMLGAGASAVYISKALREELSELRDDIIAVQKKSKRVLRYLKANGNGS